MVQFVCWFIQYTIRTSANCHLFTTATKTRPQLPSLRCEPWVVLSCQQFVSRRYLIQIRLFMIGLPLGNSKHELRTKNICYITPLPRLHNGHLFLLFPRWPLGRGSTAGRLSLNHYFKAN